MPKKQPPPLPRPPDDVFEERTPLLGRRPMPQLSGLLSGESMDLPFDDAVDLDDADMESVSDASIDDIVLTEEELIATGGFRLGQLRAVAESSKSRPRQAAKSPPPPAKSARAAKTPPKTGAQVKTVKKPAAKAKAPGFDNAWAVEAKRLLERWLPDALDVTIVRAHQVNTREPQQRLWEKHRARFGAKGDLGRALASAAVAEALRTVPQDHLVAFELRANTRYFLVWVDISEKRLVAVLSDLKVS